MPAVQDAEPVRLAHELARRGVAESHAVRLVARKSAEDLRRIAEIIEYFDHLVERKGVAAFRNGPGFLFKAVESPDRFVIPETFRRPTAKVVPPRARRAAQSSSLPQVTSADQLAEANAESQRRSSVERVRAIATVADIAAAELVARKKLAPLSNVLSSASFQEAFTRFVDDVLIKQYGCARESTA